MKRNSSIYRILAVACLCVGMVLPAAAQKERNMGIVRSALYGLQYSVRAGYNIGGVSPLPLPAEIRGVNSYNPMLGFSIEGDVEKSLKRSWGVIIGLRLENKMMRTDADVKNYKMSMVSDEGRLDGYWTGRVKTQVKNSYLTVPVLVSYGVTHRWKLKLGPYFSYLMSGDFSGAAYDGYLRKDTPVGTKVELDAEHPGTYDFSGNLQKFNWGLQLGTEWKAFSHLNVYLDLTWSMKSVFPADFETISFAMYPIYATFGFAYAF